MYTIAIVDDDCYIGNMLEEVLTRAGYSVIRAYSGTEALMLFEQTQPDLILLDLMLPGCSGEKVLTKIQKVPVIVISAKVDIQNKVNVLLGGAVDYLTKPFEMEELLARITVQLRRRPGLHPGEMLTFDEILLDPDSHRVSVSSNNVHLTKTEFAILKLLMQNPSQVITKSVMLDKIAMDTPDCMESSLKVHISNLRKKLRSINGKDYIEAVWGIGFKLREDDL
ncbi:response regulator transcription factor [Frisingicoccus caecimuris]|uniref:Stage 0 sporulation protein A homolog n=1 Tax=Frisingicoccus caecimuris TaxID=1796636 RepID=A0A4R2LLF7_9FIRM|nr:response regulator transcription factor [Frisingicoccus caecimuris]MCR1919279.1 response regulator transcription factor [Frisingicoccus caecimuris]TCO84270.1 DNA-binding response OmpR family regulator [Frisingicoccus caecimuris]HAP20227.1 DNA-binding response regulator [Lachnospiraceae bacterium]